MIGPGLFIEILVLLFLVLLNGVFAMSEIAVVSSRKSRLEHLASGGDGGARRALDLSEHPTRFLSTVQIGITLVGVFAGAFGGARLAVYLDAYLEQYPPLAPYSEGLSLGLVVAGITFLSLVLGELVPKRIALTHPERIAAFIAGPMQTLSTIAAPAVRILSVSTELLLRILRVRLPDEPPVTEHDVTSLLRTGAAAGVFEPTEQDMVERVFRLGDRRVGALLTPRHRIRWLDLTDPPEVHAAELRAERFSRYLVCEGDLDRVAGMVDVRDLLADQLAGLSLDLRRTLKQPLYVPESLPALRLLELFQESGIHLAVVIDEFGGVEGLVTLNDVMEEVTGNLTAASDPRIVVREDGSWLMDGSVTRDELWDTLDLVERSESARHVYRTLGGLVTSALHRIPRSGDVVEVDGVRLEVMDMDANRVDKVLVTPPTSTDSR